MCQRIQRKRTKGWRMPENTVYVGRPTQWGNPFKIGSEIRDNITGKLKLTLKNIDEVVAWYAIYIKLRNLEPLIKKELKGKNLACFCSLDKPCHADILLEIANT